MAETMTEKPKVRLLFETWGDFLDRAISHKSLLEDGHRESRKRDHKSFTGTDTWAEAVEIATSGWEKGANEAAKIAEAVFDRATSMVEKTEISYDVEGNGLDVGRYLDGEPECWQKFESVYQEGAGQKIIKVVVSMSISGGVPAERIMRRGAGVQAAIEALEYAGHRVELWVMDLATGGSYQDGVHKSTHMDTWVLVKRASENIDRPRAAFAVSHPAMLRRMIFACMETLETKELLSEFMVPGCYGGVGDPRVEEQGDIFVNGGYLGEEQWNTNEGVFAWVMDQLRNQGVVLREEKKAVQ